MFKNVLLGFSLLCGFLLPNHINAYSVFVGRTVKDSTYIPLTYSLAYGAISATQIAMPFPAGYTTAYMVSVAIDGNGNAVMVGYTRNADGNNIPLVYSLAYGATTATLITTTLPGGYTRGILSSVAIDAGGEAVILGTASNADGQIPLAYSLAYGATTATRITIPALPAGYPKVYMRDVAIDAAGNAVMVGETTNADSSAKILLAYSLAYGATTATPITIPALPDGYPFGYMLDVAIDAAGNAVMVGGSGTNITSPVGTGPRVPLAYSLGVGATNATQIATALPDGCPYGSISSVAIDADGNAVMGGRTQDADGNNIPLAYSWETGDSATSAIVMPPLPTGYTTGVINSVATDAAGNAVMVGYAYSGVRDIPLAYSLAYGATTATLITLPPLPDRTTEGQLKSVAIDTNGNAVMVGFSEDDSGKYTPLAYSLAYGAPNATPITIAALPAGEVGLLFSVASFSTPSGGGAFPGGAFSQQPF